MIEQTRRIPVFQPDSASASSSETPPVPDCQLRLLIISANPDLSGSQADLFESAIQCPFFEHQSYAPPLGYRALLRQSFGFIRRLRRSMSECDIVQIIESSSVPFHLFTLPAIIVSRFYGKRTLLEVDAVRAENLLERWKLPLLPILRQVNAMIVGSTHAARSLERFALHPQIIPPHVDCRTVSHRVISSLQPRLLCARPLEPDMNLVCLLHAFKLVKQKYPRAELVIAGDGPQRNQLLRLIEVERLSGITFSDPSWASLNDELQACDLMVNSSSRDDLPAILLQALAAGLPVISTDAGGIPELAQQTDALILVPLNDHTAMAEEIIRLIENPDRVRRLSNSARVIALQHSSSRARRAWASAYGFVP